MRTIIVTGGAGFIGSAVCRELARQPRTRVVVLDKLTYAASPDALSRDMAGVPFRLVNGDINDARLFAELLAAERPQAIMHLAAESHVDRSIDGPADFIATNIHGTFTLLDAALGYWRGLPPAEAAAFRFHHISTDEVFGDLPFDDSRFTEASPYRPSSPYSASKAAADHLVQAWHRTYGLPVVLSNCSNNYGPYHYPEKLIPLAILNAFEGREIGVYGTGANVRDWLFVEDHARALRLVMERGTPGESYNVGGDAERTNLQVVEAICEGLDARQPLADGRARRDLIRFVPDRPGHDRRYAIDSSRIERELGWQREESFATGLDRTIDWFLANEQWWRPIREERYGGARLGLMSAATADADETSGTGSSRIA
jgi:dTDP-glucose 4,6-dehydratase